MLKYINNLLADLTSDMNGVSTRPAALHLFNVDDGAEKLDEEKAQLFHHLVTKLLYLSWRRRQDIQMAVVILCTRVQHPDTDGYKKLAHVMKYLCSTRDITLSMEADNGPKWWVDTDNMRTHSGIYMTLRKGTTYSASSKQKLNTKSSTEAELVAIDNSIGQVLWTRHFLATTTIYQDNKSTIILAENGKTSSSKRTKHLDIRYFFVTDKIKRA